MVKLQTEEEKDAASVRRSGGGASSASISLHMSVVYAEKTELCDQLEQIADSLPDQIDRLLCLRIAGRLVPLMRQAHRFEEDLLFPLVEASMDTSENMQTIGRLKSEHVYDECSAEAITEELLRIGHGNQVRNPEAFGFMLRAFFDPVRRHLAFERELLLIARQY
jgi:hypothetical protein